MTTILKTTSKGQITIPMEWRKKFDTNQFIATFDGNRLEIQPLIIKSVNKIEEITVFDAIRDNKGNGLKAKDLVRILKKTT